MHDQTPFQLLNSIRQQAVDLAAQGLTYASQSVAVKNIAYAVNDIYFYCHADDIKEVATCQTLMPVPQTKSWMRGLINTKGQLFSVSDLSVFAGFGQPVPVNKGHLLFLNDALSQSALLVERVIGFRYFEESQRITDLDSKQELLGSLGVYVTEAFHADDRDWFYLDTAMLLNSETFREIQ